MKKILFALLIASTQAKRLSIHIRDSDDGESENVEVNQDDGNNSQLRKEYRNSQSAELQKLEKEKAKILADLAKAKKEAKEKARDEIEDPSGFRKLQK